MKCKGVIGRRQTLTPMQACLVRGGPGWEGETETGMEGVQSATKCMVVVDGCAQRH